MKNKFTRYFFLGLLFVSSQTFAASIFLDADTVATGSELNVSPLMTAFGQINFAGEIRATTSDDDFVAAGSLGNVFDIDNATDEAEFLFGFDVSSISFIFGGNSGVFNVFAFDISNNIVDSLLTTTGDGDSAGPITLVGNGIRRLLIQDPGNNFAAIDNVNIEVSAVPLPAAAWLFGSALLGFIGFTKRRNNVT